MIAARIKQSVKMDGTFEDIWRRHFTPLIYGEDSFNFIVERTLMRPRDVLKFIQFALEVAVNRNHDKVSQDDMIQAEKIYSNDMLKNLIYEIGDIYPQFPDLIYEFLGCQLRLNVTDLAIILGKAEINTAENENIIDMLLWFSFIGIAGKDGETKYAYQVKYDLNRLNVKPDSVFVIHPAFRLALECV
jgi:hypothetical protein